MLDIGNKFFNNTIFENINLKFKWFSEHPHNFYVVDNYITLNAYSGIYDIECKNDLDTQKTMFLHDISHMLLYFIRNEKYKLHKTDFGLDWNIIPRYINGKQYNVYTNTHEFMDEYKVVVLSYILQNIMDHNPIENNIEYSTMYTMASNVGINEFSIDNSDRLTRVYNALAYWESLGGKKYITEQIVKMKEYLKINSHV